MKVPFEIVNEKVESLFNSELHENQTVDNRLLEIEEFIEACGWSVDEFELFRQYGLLN